LFRSAYADRARRDALRFEDLLDIDYAISRIKKVLPTVNAELTAKGGEAVSEEEIIANVKFWAEKLASRIVEPVSFVNDAIARGESLLFEGQLGVMKDIDLGIYPYVTSSNPVAAYAAVSAGFPVNKITNVVGVVKAFTSAVGAGPFPTEMSDAETEYFRGSGENVDDEFGARTGRARRLGWLDLPMVKFAATVNGFTEIALCKLDKLDDATEIKVCIGYKLDGKEINYMPTSRILDKVEPIYTAMPGWLTETRKISSYKNLPANAKKYIELIEKYSGVTVKYIGTGPNREHLIVK
ncbi:MAG: adenylosuccinate synthetase, partial [Christensenellaceae bacterium]|nr:adenylosuccinate synthetase [Christensenellaceae bacterium]